MVGSNWIFKTKFHVDGTSNWFKACLIAQGYSQEHGLDYEKAFSSFKKLKTIRLILTLAVSLKWSFHGFLKETVYIEQPSRDLKTQIFLMVFAN